MIDGELKLSYLFIYLFIYLSLSVDSERNQQEGQRLQSAR